MMVASLLICELASFIRHSLASTSRYPPFIPTIYGLSIMETTHHLGWRQQLVLLNCFYQVGGDDEKEYFLAAVDDVFGG
ncbi:hypothetical protein [Microbulbifer sp. JMSA002]|uniref:hypothetical protein n=1 Tax=Microbulbifer sp. JMSA002 TaxID=3243368 RepID=UPI004039F355